MQKTADGVSNGVAPPLRLLASSRIPLMSSAAAATASAPRPVALPVGFYRCCARYSRPRPRRSRPNHPRLQEQERSVCSLRATHETASQKISRSRNSFWSRG